MRNSAAPARSVASRRRRLPGAHGIIGAAVAVLFALPWGAHADDAGNAETADAKPNAVLASSLATIPADEPEPTRHLESTAGSSDDAALAVKPARWTSSAELSGGQYRWSASRRGFDVGMAVAAPPQDGHRFDARSGYAGPLVPNLPSFTLGLRRDGHVPSASTLVDRATGSGRDTSYVSKFGLEWKPAQSQVKFLREGLGFRLDGQDRMTVRLRKGVLGVYMQRKF